MNTKTLWVGIFSLLAIGAAALTLVFTKPASFHGTSYGEPYPIAPQVELTKLNGDTFRLSDQQGKIVLLFFGYTSCPDVCPTTLAELKQVIDKLGDKSNLIQVTFISVDPERDTAEKIQKYVEHFNPGFIGLSGSTERLTPIWDAYGVIHERVESDSAFGYIINHTARIYLIDTQGNLRLSYGFQTPVDDIVSDLKILLNQ
jgi:protein SCO1/2